ncbi:MAG: hypothetical protein QM589_11520 [Thermomicrobiales bacterium]
MRALAKVLEFGGTAGVFKIVVIVWIIPVPLVLQREGGGGRIGFRTIRHIGDDIPYTVLADVWDVRVRVFAIEPGFLVVHSRVLSGYRLEAAGVPGGMASLYARTAPRGVDALADAA